MLTKKDLTQIEDLIDRKLDEKLDEKLEEKLNEKLKFLPTKDEFYEKMDEVMGELRAIREEHTLQVYKISDHEDRIEKLEKVTFASIK